MFFCLDTGFCDVAEALAVPPVVGLGRKGVVGVVGVPGGVWLGVEGVDVTVAGVPTED